MKVLEFRKIQTSDRADKKYEAWSRIYEYPLVLDMIKKYHDSDTLHLHNSSWGFQGCHVTFKNDLDTLTDNCIHSDIKYSSLPNTTIWDITKSCPEEWNNKFDIVLNVSTLEEVSYDHGEIFDNLMKQVRPGGLLICTFDLPGLDINYFENLFKINIQRFDNELNNHNSILPAFSNRNLECGVMVIRK